MVGGRWECGGERQGGLKTIGKGCCRSVQQKKWRKCYRDSTGAMTTSQEAGVGMDITTNSHREGGGYVER